MRLPFRQIRHQVLFLLAIVMLGAMLLLGIFATRQVRLALTEQMTENQRTLAQAVHQGLTMTFDQIFLDLNKLAEDPGLQRLDESGNKQLSDFLRQNPLFVNALVYDQAGTICMAVERADSQYAASLIGRNLLRGPTTLAGLAASLQATISENRMQVSTLHSSLRQGQMLIINIPIRPWDQPNIVRAVLSMGIHLDGALLQEMLARFTVQDGFLLLTDREGRILARQGRRVPADLARAKVTPLPEQGRRQSSWSNLAGEEYLVTALPFPQLEGVLIVGRSRTGIVTTVNSLARDMLGVALIPLLAAGLLAWLLADRYLFQILALLHGLRQVGSGVLSSRVEVMSDDELGEAGKAFNDMAEGLERNHLVEELWQEKWNRPE